MKKILFIAALSLSTITINAQVTEDWVSQDDYYGKDGIMVVAVSYTHLTLPTSDLV